MLETSKCPTQLFNEIFHNFVTKWGVEVPSCIYTYSRGIKSLINRHKHLMLCNMIPAIYTCSSSSPRQCNSPKLFYMTYLSVVLYLLMRSSSELGFRTAWGVQSHKGFLMPTRRQLHWAHELHLLEKTLIIYSPRFLQNTAFNFKKKKLKAGDFWRRSERNRGGRLQRDQWTRRQKEWLYLMRLESASCVLRVPHLPWMSLTYIHCPCCT